MGFGSESCGSGVGGRPGSGRDKLPRRGLLDRYTAWSVISGSCVRLEGHPQRAMIRVGSL